MQPRKELAEKAKQKHEGHRLHGGFGLRLRLKNQRVMKKGGRGLARRRIK